MVSFPFNFFLENVLGREDYGKCIVLVSRSFNCKCALKLVEIIANTDRSKEIILRQNKGSKVLSQEW